MATVVDSQTYFVCCLARQSMKRYRDIEAASGSDFYTEAGFLTVRSKSDSTEKDLENFENVAEMIRTEGFKLQKVSCCVSLIHCF